MKIKYINVVIITITFIFLIIGTSGCIVKTSAYYKLVISPTNGTAIIYVPVAINEDGSMSDVMNNPKVISYRSREPNPNASYEIINTNHGKALKVVTKEQIEIQNGINQRGQANFNITMWNKTFEARTGEVWIYMDNSSTAEDVNIMFQLSYSNTVFVIAQHAGTSITTEQYANDRTSLKKGWNVYPIYEMIY